MPDHAGASKSIWMNTASLPAFGPVGPDEMADVVIVGAGIAGLSTAYLLGRAGKSVIVLDDGPIASGETERTTAHLSCALDDRYVEIERLHGEHGAQLAAESHATAIDTIEQIVAAERIACDFRRLDGFLFPASPEDEALLEREFAAAHRAGLPDVELLDRSPLRGFNPGRVLRFPRQAQFHPLKYLAGLTHAIIRDGGKIFTQSHVIGIQGGKPARIQTAHGSHLTAGAVVVATNTPVNDRVVIHTKQASYRSYVIAATVPRDSVPPGLYWDTGDPYHYVRLQPGSAADKHDVLIVGGEDHKTGQADDTEARYTRLEEWTRGRFSIGEVKYRWSGQVMEPVDYLAYIGRNPLDHDNVYIATGDSGHGMTHGTIAGLLLTDLIFGRRNSWESLYNPSRVTAGAASEYARENTNMAAQYGDWLKPADVEDESHIAPGTGALLQRGLSKVAAYRDDQGELHECSAMCPHLGGVVCWNHAEKTWDCPVHGSRFDRFGKVVNGPAIADLKPVEKVARTK